MTMIKPSANHSLEPKPIGPTSLPGRPLGEDSSPNRQDIAFAPFSRRGVAAELIKVDP